MLSLVILLTVLFLCALLTLQAGERPVLLSGTPLLLVTGGHGLVVVLHLNFLMLASQFPSLGSQWFSLFHGLS